MKVDVVKRDGTLEVYDESKIVRVAEATGLDNIHAQAVAKDVTEWIKSNSLLKVTSLQIRDAVLSNLKKINEASADLFTWYEGTKDNHPFEGN